MKNESSPTFPQPTGARYWRSLDELAETPEFREFVEREFPSGASELTDPVSRRHFVKIMSASLALAGFGLTGCRRPEHEILPFGSMPEGYTHGVPRNYATAMPARGSAVPLVAQAHDGRPTKLEGNPEHPGSQGGTDAFAQASILNLYDADRATRFARQGRQVDPKAAFDHLAEVAAAAQENGGKGLRILGERSSSVSRLRLLRQMADKLPEARFHAYEPVDFDIHRQAASLAFGRSVKPDFHFDKASVIVSLDSDFLGAEEDAAVHIRRFAQGRRMKDSSDSMSRLYVAEPLFSVTGVNADHRLRVSASGVGRAAARLAQEIARETGASGLAEALSGWTDGMAEHEEWIVECAKDLLAHRGEGLVVAGHRQPLEVHLLAHAINSALGNVGHGVTLHETLEPGESSLEELVEALNAGEVETLVILGGNPVYNAPADLKWPEAQRKAGTVIRLGYYEDETALLAEWHLPLAHFLESWGDARSADGTVVAVQPLIAPLFGGLTEIETLARLLGEETTDPHEIVRATFRKVFGDDENAWRKFLHDGFAADTAYRSAAGSLDIAAVQKAVESGRAGALPSKEGLEVVFHRDYSLDDGRYTNNGWLQELPDPITKLTWENVILMSRRTAEELGVGFEDPERDTLSVPVARVELDGRRIEGPVWIQPGMADYTLGLALGYGRAHAGRVGKDAGFNAYALRTQTRPHFASGAKLSPTGRLHQVAGTQNHWAMEGRPIVREANLDQYRQYPDFATRMNMAAPPSEKPMYPNPLHRFAENALHQWGMVVDLQTCVGCSACVVACQSENNVPIVGKEQVSKSREMHWLRVDRFFAGDADDPQAVTQPMMCQHCEAAPCESVCPVNATVHDREGLNLMVYNRCVGTRYCSNNCPYKVRRFNFFDYNRRPLDELYKSPLLSKTDGEWELKRWFTNPSEGSKADDEWDLLRMAKNPDVSVRMRGVMEKCTFCVQRIEEAKIAQKVKARDSGNVRVPDGTIQTACQQACPADAIVFGDISDPDSEVSQARASDRNYTVLEFLSTHPRLTYLGRVRNPNPAMPDYRPMPDTLRNYAEEMAHMEDPFASTHGGGEHSMENGNGGHEGAESEKGAH